MATNTSKEENINKLMLEEYKELNKEITDIKVCQRTYFWSTATIVGVLIAYGAQAKVNHYLIMFIPILVISPMWCIYFLKSTTITRIGGYIRILEEMIINGTSEYEYKGWFNSLKAFRDDQKVESGHLTERLKNGIKRAWLNSHTNVNECNEEEGNCNYSPGIKKVFNFEAPNQHYYLDWLGFALLESCSFLLMIFNLDDKDANWWLFFFAFFIVFVSSTYTLNIISEITCKCGRRGTTYRENKWKEILSRA